MSDDYYGDVVRQRTDAASILADECRKKDAALAQLSADLDAAREELLRLYDLRRGVKQLENDVENLRVDLAKLARY